MTTTGGKGKKIPKLVKTFNICVLGPSYVGKTQLVNRIINNSFTGYYEPTIKKQTYRRVYNINEDNQDEEPKFFDITMWDMFPHDHPFLDEDEQLMGEEAKEMERELSEVIKNPFPKNKEEETEHPFGTRVHAYIFVYDYSNKRTFDSMLCMLETIKELEKSQKKGSDLASKSKKKEGSKSGPVFPKMIVIGNKKDLQKNRNAGSLKKEDIEKLDGTKIIEVSALTNENVMSAFKSLV